MTDSAREGSFLPYWYSLWAVAALALLGLGVEQLLGYRAVGFLFLSGLLALGLFFPLGPVLFGGLLSALVWDFFFIPPKFTFIVHDTDDALMMAAFLLAAGITGALTSRVRSEHRALKDGEGRSALLYRLASLLSAADARASLPVAARMLESSLGREFGFVLADPGQPLARLGLGSATFLLRDHEMPAAAEAMKSPSPSGWPGSRKHFKGG